MIKSLLLLSASIILLPIQAEAQSLITDNEQADIRIDFGDAISGQPGDTVTIHVKTNNLDGLNVANFDFRFSFDPDLIQFSRDDVLPGDLVASITRNVTQDNRILVSFADFEPIQGSGTLFRMTGTLTGPGENESGITVTEILMGDGSLEVTPSIPHSIAVNVSDESLAWSITPEMVELEGPDASLIEFIIEQTGGAGTLEWSAETDADWLTPDGSATGSGNGTLRYAVAQNTDTEVRNTIITVNSNAGAKTAEIIQPGRQAPSIIELDFGEAINAAVGEDVILIIQTSDLTGLGIANFDFRFAYDPELLEFERSGILAGGLVTSVTGNVTSDARILVSFADSTPIQGTGELFRLRGKAIAAGSNTVGIRVNEVLMGDGSADIQPPMPYIIPVEVSAVLPAAPQLIFPGNGSTDLDPDVTLEWDKSGYSDSYQVQISTDAEFTNMTIDSSGVLGQSIDVDNLDEETTYFWKVRGSNVAGYSDWSAVYSFSTKTVTSVEYGGEIPATVELLQNYPNPFNSSTNIRYSIPEASHVRIEVFNSIGQRVAFPVNTYQSFGWHLIAIDASDLSSGLYLVKMKSSRTHKLMKILLIK